MSTSSLYVDQLWQELFNTLTSAMSKIQARRIIGEYRHIEQNYGVKRLLDRMGEIKQRLVDLHTSFSRKELIEQERAGSIRWKGPTRAFLSVSLRKTGVERAINLAQLKKLFFAAEPTISDYCREANRLNKLRDPFLDYHNDPVFGERTEASLRRLRKFVYPMSPQMLELAKQVSLGEKEYWKMPYPFDDKKSFISEDESIPGRLTTPEDLVRSLFTISPLVYDEYDYFLYLVGKDLMPARETFESDKTYADMVVGKSPMLNKDGGMKQRLIYIVGQMVHLAVAPIHNFGFALLDKCPASYVRDQEGGMQRMAEMLAEGRHVASLDLDSASDHISLEASLALFWNWMPDFPHKRAVFNCYRALARGKFLPALPHKKRGNVFLRHLFGDGQGMRGSFPKMAAFIIEQACKSVSSKTGKFATFDDFGDVGDDFFIAQEFFDSLEQREREAKMPLNLSKSVIDASWGNFCARVITRDGVLNIFKAKLHNPDNPLPTVRRLGFRALETFDKIPLDHQELVGALKWALFKKETSAFTRGLFPTEEEPLNVGGYTIHQYYRMGLLTANELKALETLIAYKYGKSFPANTMAQLLDFYVTYKEVTFKVVDRKKRRFERTKSFKLRDEIPLIKQWDYARYGLPEFESCVQRIKETDKRLKPRFLERNFARELDRMIEGNLDLLHSELKKQKIPVLNLLQPSYNGKDVRDLHSRYKRYQQVQSQSEVQFGPKDEKPGDSIYNYIPQEFWDMSLADVQKDANDVQKPAVRAIYEDYLDFDSDSRLADPCYNFDEDRIYDFKKLESDLLEGEDMHHKSGLLAVWWAAITDKAFWTPRVSEAENFASFVGPPQAPGQSRPLIGRLLQTYNALVNKIFH